MERGEAMPTAHRARVAHDEYAERSEDCPLDVNTAARGPGTDQPTDECNRAFAELTRPAQPSLGLGPVLTNVSTAAK
jgi:hypothetical protein